MDKYIYDKRNGQSVRALPKTESGQPNGMDWQNECSAVCGYGKRQCRGDLRMRKRKYYLNLTAKERWYVFNALLAFRNKLIAQGRYTDAVDEVMIKFEK